MDEITPEWLAQELRKPGRSQAGLARALGLDTSAVNRLCRGKRQIKLMEERAIRAYLGDGDTLGVPASPNARLRAARVAAGHETIADAARVHGFHKQNLADHEAGRRGMDAGQAAAYGAAFGVDPAYLLFGGDAPSRPIITAPFSIEGNPKDPTRVLLNVRDADVPFDVGMEIMRLIKEATRDNP